MDSLLTYSAVCGTGLGTVPLPGDVNEERLAQILSDVAALAWKWHKPLSARLQPVKDKKAGDPTDFASPYLFNTTLPTPRSAVSVGTRGGPESVPAATAFPSCQTTTRLPRVRACAWLPARSAAA
jgi:uncharacterized protein (UPF0210 family)